MLVLCSFIVGVSGCLVAFCVGVVSRFFSVLLFCVVVLCCCCCCGGVGVDGGLFVGGGNLLGLWVL